MGVETQGGLYGCGKCSVLDEDTVGAGLDPVTEDPSFSEPVPVFAISAHEDTNLCFVDQRAIGAVAASGFPTTSCREDGREQGDERMKLHNPSIWLKQRRIIRQKRGFVNPIEEYATVVIYENHFVEYVHGACV